MVHIDTNLFSFPDGIFSDPRISWDDSTVNSTILGHEIPVSRSVDSSFITYHDLIKNGIKCSISRNSFNLWEVNVSTNNYSNLLLAGLRVFSIKIQRDDAKSVIQLRKNNLNGIHKIENEAEVIDYLIDHISVLDL